MFLPAPQLDDTRWSDLVEQSRGLLPSYAPAWTDHNLSDPGITLVDLLAWFAEMQIFQLDKVPERHRRAFLALAGVAPEPPRAARAVLRFAVPDGAPPAPLRAGLACEGPGPVGFRTLHAMTVVPGHVSSLGAAGHDVTAAWQRGDPVAPFGTDPEPGATLEVGLSASALAGVTLTLAIATRHGRHPGAPAHHHDAEVEWEALVGGSWAPVTVARDGTRALARDGRVELVLPATAQRLRARYVRGAYDAVPWLRDVVLNGADAEQAVVVSERWTIAPGATVVGTPTPGTMQPLGIEVDPLTGAITRLDVTAASAPQVEVLGYGPGELHVAAQRLGTSTGDPGQVFTIEPAPLDAASVRVYAGHGPTWRRLHPHADLIASGPADGHIVLDAATGDLTVGDGAHGVVPLRGHLVIATARATLAESGNVRAGTVDRIIGGPPGVTVSQPLDATGGARAETLGEAEARAEQLAGATTRAVTAADVEWLVRTTPGTQVARVAVVAELHPGLTCVRAPGVVTVVVVPWLPAGRPVPSGGLLGAVAARLAPHRLVGTRFEVAGPRYVEVTVVATVAAHRLAVPAEVRRRAVAALDAWLDPLAWPFGRDVVRAEALQVLDEVDGVDHVLTLELIGPCGETCGNLCLGPLELPVAGEHAIGVTR